jgi:hypothetical protein
MVGLGMQTPDARKAALLRNLRGDLIREFRLRGGAQAA